MLRAKLRRICRRSLRSALQRVSGLPRLRAGSAVIRALCARCRIFPLLLVLASRGWPRCPVCGRQIALVQSVSCRASAKSSGALTALCGSGPAYVFYFIEALEDAARRLGFDDTRARTLARTTFTGAAALAAQSGAAASALRAQVSPPNGTTAAALALFDAKRMREAIVRGVLAAHQRAIEIASAPGHD